MPGTTLATRRPLVGAAAVLAVLASACTGPGTTRDGRGLSGPDDPEASRSQVRDVVPDLLASLTAADGSLGSRRGSVRFSYGDFVACADDASRFAYDTNARVDLEGRGVDALPDVRADLEQDGWSIDETPAGADPSRSVTAVEGDLVVRVKGGAKPFVLVQVLGPCLAVTDEQRDAFESSPGSEPLER